MKKVFAALKNCLNEENGATAVEYSILLAVIVAIVFVGAGLLGTETSNLWASNVAKILAL